MITTCSRCSKLYEEASEETANYPGRMCAPCWRSFVAWLAAETPKPSSAAAQGGGDDQAR